MGIHWLPKPLQALLVLLGVGLMALVSLGLYALIVMFIATPYLTAWYLTIRPRTMSSGGT